MLKNILKLEGVEKLTKNEQKSINGAGAYWCPEYNCHTRLGLVDGRMTHLPCGIHNCA